MSPRWLLLRDVEPPAGDGWLGPAERAALARLRFPKRRQEWRLGRLAAKTALTRWAARGAGERGAGQAGGELAAFAIIAAGDGAPEAHAAGQRLPVSISISHRDGVALCALGPEGMVVGCDLEVVEPRSERFVADFFTAREHAWVQSLPRAVRDRAVALTWSAKESALKLLRVGLRRDTRCVEVDVDAPGAEPGVWQPLAATVQPEGLRLHGFWRVDGDLVATMFAHPAGGPPALLSNAGD